ANQSYYPILPLLDKLGKSAKELEPALIAQYFKTPVSAKKMVIVRALLTLEVDKAKMDPVLRDFLPHIYYGSDRHKMPVTSEVRQSILTYARKNNIPIPAGGFGGGGQGFGGRDGQ
ncbi:MAG TPA: hypothetical protein VGP68_12085, partial [Gemmataceae bacterium]|nr:hypothetical protein [Gemmataceae bacterium]